MSAPAAALVAWYAVQGRDLPWRHTRDPYAIWLSESILQQTRIVTGQAYYERFLARFPTLADLAGAAEREVLKLWEGLGYYSRARNLLRTAQVLMQAHGGQFPATVDGLLALPGVGPYTARAIASLAFGVRAAVLDGNVFRVLSRLHADATPIDGARARAHFQPLADRLLGAEVDPAAFNQAVMDLGATVCLPRNPRCEACPVQAYCQAYRQQAVALYPVKGGKKAVPVRYQDWLLVADAQRVVVRQRTETRLWQGLWELPYREVADWTRPPAEGAEWHRLTHAFSHYTLQVRVCRVDLGAYALQPGDELIGWDEVPQLAFNRAALKVFAAWQARQQAPDLFG